MAEVPGPGGVCFNHLGHTVADILDMTVEEALSVMENVPAVRRALQTLHDVGLDYVHLGQPATTLSGGEAQRIKLARELARRSTGRTSFWGTAKAANVTGPAGHGSPPPHTIFGVTVPAPASIPAFAITAAAHGAD